ncbi:MAG: hypothetical protein ACI9R3_006501 [Verrucomicrobiales bacterium]|jgi:hypothetical protein
MNPRRLRHFLLIPAAAIAMVCLNSCCCPCNSEARLMEDFWVSSERQVEWLQHQRVMSPSNALAEDAIDFLHGSEK